MSFEIFAVEGVALRTDIPRNLLWMWPISSLIVGGWSCQYSPRLIHQSLRMAVEL